jgi:hypothetical protein
MDFFGFGSDMGGWETIRATASTAGKIRGRVSFGLHIPTETANQGAMFGKAAVATLFPLLFQTARAVVVLSGAANDTAPPGQPYFGNLGTVNGASAIYLGDRWVMTAAHVANVLPAGATFSGTTYATAAGTFHRLNNPTGSGLSTLTDIVLFRLGVDPGLPALTIANAAPTVGDPVMMIGAGRQQEAAKSYWQVSGSTWTELSPPNSSITHFGYETTGTYSPRWGMNDIGEVAQDISYGHGDVHSFFTSFDDGAHLHEAQAVSGDSGGAVLFHNGADWVLTGMMVAVATFTNQPGGADTAVVGNITAAADLAFYQERIYEVIPEPSTVALVMSGMLVFARRPRRSLALHPRENP